MLSAPSPKIGPSANNLTETFAYSADRLQLTTQNVTKGSTLMSLTYDYTSAIGELGGVSPNQLPANRNNGQLLGVSGTLNGSSAAQTFTYDTLGRLVTATGQGSAGNDTVGAYAPATAVWNLRNSNSGGPADVTFGYGTGLSGYQPIAGDWDGDGDDTIGLYDPVTGNFFLRNTNSAGGADLTFQFGAGGGIPVAGDWNGDGVDTIGFYTSASQTFYLRNSNSAGSADYTFSFGAFSSWIPIVGDWDGDGDDTIGSFDPSNNGYYLRNSNSAGGADISFTFGTGGGTPLAGDWNGDGIDTIGYRTSAGFFNLRNSNTPGSADFTPFSFSSSSDIPVMGDWDGLGSGGASWQRRYGYDRWTNRTSVHDATTGGTQIQSVGIVGGTSTPTNRITTVTEGVQNFSYDYDDAGNVTDDGVHTYKYDAANRLAEVDGGTTATYSYDAANRRVKTVALGVTTYTVWDGMHAIMEIDSLGALVEDYVYSGSRLLATERGGTTYFHHQDRLSTRLLTNSAGAVVGTSSHLPYGEDGLQTGVESRNKFTSYDRDGETDNDYAMNRHSSPATGRFVQPDPVAGSTSSPQSLNRYAYVRGDPANLIDPSGLDPVVRRPATPSYINPQGGFSAFDVAGLGLRGLDALQFGWRLNPGNLYGAFGAWALVPGGGEIGFGSSVIPVSSSGGGLSEFQSRLSFCLKAHFGIFSFSLSGVDSNGTLSAAGGMFSATTQGTNVAVQTSIDTTTHTMASLKARIIAGGGDLHDGFALGAVFKSEPKVAYIGSSIFLDKTPTRASHAFVHELGNSLAFQLDMQWSQGDANARSDREEGVRPDRDFGRTFERCVFGTAKLR